MDNTFLIECKITLLIQELIMETDEEYKKLLKIQFEYLRNKLKKIKEEKKEPY